MRRSSLLWNIVAVAALVLAVSTLWPLGGGAASAAPQGSPWGANYFPNVPLVTHDGKTVRFYEDLIKDKKVLVNFIYASCQKACPLATAKLVQVQKRLGDRVGRDIFIYSITLDPEHDTPEVLKKYAQTYRTGPGWLFLTGKREDVDVVRFKLGERSEKEEHTNTVRVGNDARGQWMKLPLFDDVNHLVGEIGRSLDPKWDAGKPVKSYADAPQREISVEAAMLLKGQALFQNRCATCHTIGKGDLLGPDLKGITARRDRAWLARFIAFPDEMRARKDPIAVELSAKYKSVPMPNTGLTREQVADLIDFLEAQTNALEEKELKGKTPDKAARSGSPPSLGQPFPATGQTTCWDSSGTVIACAGTGQDGDILAGAALSYTDNGDGTITDNNTGLMWEKKSFDGSVHDMRTTYRWDQAFAVHVAGLNAANFAGHNDWRLPNLKELQSIVNYGNSVPTVSPAFNNKCTPSATVLSGSCTANAYYWSSSSLASNPRFAWYIVFDEGAVEDGEKKDRAFHVRAVRGGSKGKRIDAYEGR